MSKLKKTNKILPLFIPFLGCKNRCIYCNQNSITGISFQDSPRQLAVDKELNQDKILSDIKQQLKKAIGIYGDDCDEVAYYGGTFGELSSELRSELYAVAGTKDIRFSTSPVKAIDPNFLEEIATHRPVVELGVQSLVDSVLKINGRRYSYEDVVNNFSVLNRYVKTCVQLMVGMYTERVDDILFTSSMLSKLTPTYVRIYPTMVLKNTKLAQLYMDGEYTPISAIDTILRSAWLYIESLSIGAEVIRIGLPAEVNGTDVIAGYWHPALGDIVKTLVVCVYISEYRVAPNFQHANYNGAAMKIIKGLDNGKLLLQEKKGVATMADMCRKIKEVYSEGKQWFTKEQVVAVAERLVS